LQLIKQCAGDYEKMKIDKMEFTADHQQMDVCEIDKVMEHARRLGAETGATAGLSGDLLYYGQIRNKNVVAKMMTVKQSRSQSPRDEYYAYKRNNEIGITKFISEYFLEYPKLTDNFTLFYMARKCPGFIDKYVDNKLFNKFAVDGLVDRRVNIMIVEKAMSDFKGFLHTNTEEIRKNSMSIELSDIFVRTTISIFIQICYSLLMFDKCFGLFYHGDLHCGNILIGPEDIHQIKKYIIKLDDSHQYKINIKTYGRSPKLWDFSNSYVQILFDMYNNQNMKALEIFDYLGEGAPAHTKFTQELLKSKIGTIGDDIDNLIDRTYKVFIGLPDDTARWSEDDWGKWSIYEESTFKFDEKYGQLNKFIEIIFNLTKISRAEKENKKFVERALVSFIGLLDHTEIDVFSDMDTDYDFKYDYTATPPQYF
jgi:hypothetical protein